MPQTPSSFGIKLGDDVAMEEIVEFTVLITHRQTSIVYLTDSILVLVEM